MANPHVITYVSSLAPCTYSRAHTSWTFREHLHLVHVYNLAQFRYPRPCASCTCQREPVFCHSTCTCILDLSNFLCIMEMCTSHLACVLSHMPTCTHAPRTYPSACSLLIMTMLLVFVQYTYTYTDQGARAYHLFIRCLSFIYEDKTMSPCLLEYVHCSFPRNIYVHVTDLGNLFLCIVHVHLSACRSDPSFVYFQLLTNAFTCTSFTYVYEKSEIWKLIYFL